MPFQSIIMKYFRLFMRLPGKYMNGFICIIFYLTHLSSLRAKEQDISAYPHFTHKKSTMTSALSHSAKRTPLFWKHFTNTGRCLLWAHCSEQPCGFPQVLNISLQLSKASVLVNHPNHSSIMQSPIHNTQNVLAAFH